MSKSAVYGNYCLLLREASHLLVVQLTTKMNCKPQFSNLFSKHIFTRTPTGKFHKQRIYFTVCSPSTCQIFWKAMKETKMFSEKKELWHTDTRYELSRYFCSHKISCEPHWAKKWSNLSKLDWKHCELYSQRVTKTCLNLSKLV